MNGTNFIFVKGCKPGYTVDGNTKLIRDSMRNLLEQGDKKTMTVNFPEVIDQIKGTDSNIEIIKSSTLQNMRMDFFGFPIVKSECYIFVQPTLQRGNLEPLVYPNAEVRASETYGFFKDDLKFDQVEICRDFSKEDFKMKIAEI